MFQSDGILGAFQLVETVPDDPSSDSSTVFGPGDLIVLENVTGGSEEDGRDLVQNGGDRRDRMAFPRSNRTDLPG